MIFSDFKNNYYYISKKLQIGNINAYLSLIPEVSESYAFLQKYSKFEYFTSKIAN